MIPLLSSSLETLVKTQFANVFQNDNCHPREGRQSTSLSSCFERHLTCFFYNPIHLMGHRLLELDWVANLKCFQSGSFMPGQKLWGEISASTECPLLKHLNVEVSHDVEGRQKDLLNPSQRESLGQHLEQIKTLAPILICSMKIFIQILNQASKTPRFLFGSNAQD